MRPFGELVEGFPRLVRDVARQLGKKVRLQVDGASTDVDRDVAALLDAPLNHVVETRSTTVSRLPPIVWRRARARSRPSGCPPGTVRGCCTSRWRTTAGAWTSRSCAGGWSRAASMDEATSQRLSEQELLEFLFLPGFTTADTVTDISGRGVGLDVVLETMKRVGGRARIGQPAGDGVVGHLRTARLAVGPAGAGCRGGRGALCLPADATRPGCGRGTRPRMRTIEGRQYVSVPVDGLAVTRGTDAEPRRARPVPPSARGPGHRAPGPWGARRGARRRRRLGRDGAAGRQRLRHRRGPGRWRGGRGRAAAGPAPGQGAWRQRSRARVRRGAAARA